MEPENKVGDLTQLRISKGTVMCCFDLEKMEEEVVLILEILLMEHTCLSKYVVQGEAYL